MWERIKHKIIQINKATGVQVHFTDQHFFSIFSSTLSVQKGQLIKESITHSCTKVSELKINKNNPLALVFTGKGVLIKKIASPANDNSLTTAFPQINPNDFYSQLINFKGFAAVAIIRKEVADNIIRDFQDQGFHVTEFSLGFESIGTMLPFFSKVSSFTATPYQLNLENGTIKDFELQKEFHQTSEYVLSSQYIHSTHLLSYAAAAKLIAGNIESSPDLLHDTIIQNRESLIFKRYFNLSGITLVAIVFLLLLINFLLYNYYFTNNNKLEVEQSLSKNTSSKTDALIKDVANKEAFIRELGWSKQQKISFFADRLAGLVPSETWLQSMEFNPIKKSFMTEENSIHFRNDTIIVSGTCADATQINTFINNIRTLNEIKNASLKNYSYKKIDDEGSFSLEIITK